MSEAQQYCCEICGVMCARYSPKGIYWWCKNCEWVPHVKRTRLLLLAQSVRAQERQAAALERMAEQGLSL
jgi:hypothetical protein